MSSTWTLVVCLTLSSTAIAQNDDFNNPTSVQTIVGAIVAISLALVCVLVLMAVLRRRRRRIAMSPPSARALGMPQPNLNRGPYLAYPMHYKPPQQTGSGEPSPPGPPPQYTPGPPPYSKQPPEYDGEENSGYGRPTPVALWHQHPPGGSSHPRLQTGHLRRTSPLPLPGVPVAD
ncbi:uncharacterized protein BXZ73DRAFT_98626 [Epithele typhae]|uniref:uncharacterized protein n=1 Tax=Epithele typhae TaxID=378194 RepID=UPI0020078B1F|nr:uncharacterized protein BXZ73DRAFT_98626 [Epithele typhae]KAH9940799.1 hypothetical protein BXZ73DRAFT_98626 [Epithele typhae]